MEYTHNLLNDIQTFFKSRIILTACELDVFTELHERPMAPSELAASHGWDTRAIHRLLDCLVSFGLLEKFDSRYQNSEPGSYLSSQHPLTIRALVLHYSHLWHRWSRLTEIVQNGPEPDAIPLDGRDPGIQRAFIGAMHAIGRSLSEEIADLYDLTPFRCLLDIGGASGTYTIAFLKKNPNLRAILFDLPTVIPLAEERIRNEGLEQRVTLVTGDFYKDDLPASCDLALLSAIIHQNSPGQNVDLYAKAYRALDPGGVILIRDFIMDDSRTKPSQGAVFALNMLLNTPGGDTYTFAEVSEQLTQAGFQHAALVHSDERMASLVEARKPRQ